MKNIIFIIFSVLLLSSCFYQSKDTYKPYNSRVIIECNKHRLLRVRNYGASPTPDHFIYVHSVDCKCGQVTSLDSALYFMYNNYPTDEYKKKDDKIYGTKI